MTRRCRSVRVNNDTERALFDKNMRPFVRDLMWRARRLIAAISPRDSGDELRTVERDLDHARSIAYITRIIAVVKSLK